MTVFVQVHVLEWLGSTGSYWTRSIGWNSTSTSVARLKTTKRSFHRLLTTPTLLDGYCWENHWTLWSRRPWPTSMQLHDCITWSQCYYIFVLSLNLRSEFRRFYFRKTCHSRSVWRCTMMTCSGLIGRHAKLSVQTSSTEAEEARSWTTLTYWWTFTCFIENDQQVKTPFSLFVNIYVFFCIFQFSTPVRSATVAAVTCVFCHQMAHQAASVQSESRWLGMEKPAKTVKKYIVVLHNFTVFKFLDFLKKR